MTERARQSVSVRTGARLMLAAALAGATGTVLACSSEDYVSSVCAMAGPYRAVRGLQLADGSLMQVQQYQALYALIGNTYGGTANVNFNVPNLQGRFVLGAGKGADGVQYNVGQSGGAATATLTTPNLPAHAHALGGTPATITGTVDLSKVTGTATLDKAVFTAPASGLTLLAANANGDGPNPAGQALGIANVPPAKLYTNTAPTVPMASNMIGGTLSGNLSGTVPVAFTGTAPVTVALSGTTGQVGGGAPFSTMPPYVAMPYYIVTLGYFPASN